MMMRKKTACPMYIEESMPNVDWEFVQGRPRTESENSTTDGADQEPVDNIESPVEVTAYIVEPKKRDLLSTVNLLMCVAFTSWGAGYLIGQATFSRSRKHPNISIHFAGSPLTFVVRVIQRWVRCSTNL
jgi:hypothetical protein